jgi:hypothetical protein
LPALVVARSGNQIRIEWSAGTLQSATSVTGLWSNVSAAASSPYTFTPTDAQLFFRAKQ